MLVAETGRFDNADKTVLNDMIMGMSQALRANNINEARKLVKHLLIEILGYEPERAEFVINNHLNKNAGWG